MTMSKRWFATIGTDGRRAVVWGLGNTEEAAERDAKREAAHAECDARIIGTAEIDAKRAAKIKRGDVAAEDLVRDARLGPGREGER